MNFRAIAIVVCIVLAVLCVEAGGPKLTMAQLNLYAPNKHQKTFSTQVFHSLADGALHYYIHMGSNSEAAKARGSDVLVPVQVVPYREGGNNEAVNGRQQGVAFCSEWSQPARDLRSACTGHLAMDGNVHGKYLRKSGTMGSLRGSSGTLQGGLDCQASRKG